MSESTETDVCGSCGYQWPIAGPSPDDGFECEHCVELRKLAESCGLELRLEKNPDDPCPDGCLWAIFGWNPTDDEDQDIIGAGDSPSEAIENAREQLARWDAMRDEKNSDAWTAHDREPSR